MARYRFQAALLAGWIALGAAGAGYARIKNIPSSAALPVLAAFLTAYPFYLVPGFPSLRERVSGPLYHLAAALLPYLVGCFGALQFRWTSVGLLAALALIMAFWFRLLPRSRLTDLAFLAIIPAALLTRFLPSIYVPVDPKFRGEVVFLGHIALITMAFMTLLAERQAPDSGFGFLPTRRDWRIGGLHFLYFAPVGLLVALPLHVVRFTGKAPVLLLLPTFFGFLWTVALSEEFFIWGVLQKLTAGSMAIPAAVFGLIHIGFRYFPNWGWVLLAAILGWFCGRARNQAGSIRAGMVTHALVFAAWRTFFS